MGVKVEYEVADWNTVLTAMRTPADAAGAPRRDAINHGLPISDPTQLLLNFGGAAVPPNGSNWSVYRDQNVDKLFDEAFRTFEPGRRGDLITQAHALIVDDAPWLFVVHDLNPRALSPEGEGLRPGTKLVSGFHAVAGFAGLALHGAGEATYPGF